MIYYIGKLFHQPQKRLLLLLPLCFNIPCLGNYKIIASAEIWDSGLLSPTSASFRNLEERCQLDFNLTGLVFPSFGILLWNGTGVSVLTCGYESREVCCVTISLSCQITSFHIYIQHTNIPTHLTDSKRQGLPHVIFPVQVFPLNLSRYLVPMHAYFTEYAASAYQNSPCMQYNHRQVCMFYGARLHHTCNYTRMKRDYCRKSFPR